MMRARSCAAGLVISLTACAAPEGVKTAATTRSLVVSTVDWNPTHAAVGAPVAVADVGTVVVVFAPGEATILADGAVANVDHAVATWRSGATIPAPDGTGLWIVGVDGDGQLRHLAGRRAFEPVSARYGLNGTKIRDVAGFGGRYVGFALEDPRVGLAIADGHEVRTYRSGALDGIVGGGVHATARSGASVRTIDARSGADIGYQVEGATYVAADSEGRPFVATQRAIYEADDSGALTLRYLSESGAIHGLAAARDVVWFADGDELGRLAGNDVARTTGAKIGSDSRISGSPSGDVWVIGKASLARYSVRDVAPAAPGFASAIQPVFARSCAPCHGEHPSSGIELGNAEAWQRKHDLIRQRVLVDKDMPPKDHPITDADRESIRAWLDAGAHN